MQNKILTMTMDLTLSGVPALSGSSQYNSSFKIVSRNNHLVNAYS